MNRNLNRKGKNHAEKDCKTGTFSENLSVDVRYPVVFSGLRQLLPRLPAEWDTTNDADKGRI
jgi:hypothetical protein